jgi:hypothetical protein
MLYSIPESANCLTVAADSKVGVVPTNLAAQGGMLLGKWSVTIGPTPLADSFHSTRKSRFHRLAVNTPTTPAALPPVMCETQKIDAILDPGFEFSHNGLFRMQCQAVAAKTLRQYLHHPGDILVVSHSTTTGFSRWLLSGPLAAPSFARGSPNKYFWNVSGAA